MLALLARPVVTPLGALADLEDTLPYVVLFLSVLLLVLSTLRNFLEGARRKSHFGPSTTPALSMLRQLLSGVTEAKLTPEVFLSTAAQLCAEGAGQNVDDGDADIVAASYLGDAEVSSMPAETDMAEAHESGSIAATDDGNAVMTSPCDFACWSSAYVRAVASGATAKVNEVEIYSSRGEDVALPPGLDVVHVAEASVVDDVGVFASTAGNESSLSASTESSELRACCDCEKSWGCEEHHRYSSSLLLAHKALRFRIAHGPPGLERASVVDEFCPRLEARAIREAPADVPVHATKADQVVADPIQVEDLSSMEPPTSKCRIVLASCRQ